MSLANVWYEIFSTVDVIQKALENNGNIYILGKDLDSYSDCTKTRITLIVVIQENTVAKLDRSGTSIIAPSDVDKDGFIDISDTGMFSNKVYSISRGRSIAFGEKATRRFHIYPFKYYRYYSDSSFATEYDTKECSKFLVQDFSSVFTETVTWNTSFPTLSKNGLSIPYISVAEGAECISIVKLRVKGMEVKEDKFRVYTYGTKNNSNVCSLPPVCWEMIKWSPTL